MTKQTQPYKKQTFAGSVAAGLGSIFKAGGKKYYILEHKVTSKFHKAGEWQEIIVDNIELGRSNKCQVQFDDSFATVSARHAAIVKDGDNWKLVQLSQTNSTLLNGHKVEKEWYLQNGDEIQLSVAMSVPLMRTVPLSADMQPVMIFIVVLLPAPLGPRNPTTSPLSMRKEMSLTAMFAP